MFWRDRPGVSWSVGVPGVVAEFHAPAGQALSWEDHDGEMSALCTGGAISIGLRGGVLPCVFDLDSARHGHRLRGILFCLPRDEADVAPTHVLAEVGTRADAALFNVGAGVSTLEPLVLVTDPSLAGILRDALGERLVGTHHPALMALMAASPPRLFRSALAEITVTQPIAVAETPVGPHTHLLPELIDGTTHDPRIAVPDLWIPCLTLHIPDHDAAFDVASVSAHR